MSEITSYSTVFWVMDNTTGYLREKNMLKLR